MRGSEVAWFRRGEVGCYYSYFGLFLVAGLGFGFWLMIWGHLEMEGRPNLRRCMSIRQHMPPPYIQKIPEADTHDTGVVFNKLLRLKNMAGQVKTLATAHRT